MKQFVVIYYIEKTKWAKVLKAESENDARKKMLEFAKENEMEIVIYDVMRVMK